MNRHPYIVVLHSTTTGDVWLVAPANGTGSQVASCPRRSDAERICRLLNTEAERIRNLPPPTYVLDPEDPDARPITELER